MPTFKIVLGSHKKDKTRSVSIQLYNESDRDKKYLPTPYFVVKSQLSGKGAIKDVFLLEKLNDRIKGYREKLLKLENIDDLSAQEIKDFLTGNEKKQDIDFIKFGRDFAATQKETTGKNTLTALNAFIDFLGRDTLSISQINLKLLNDFARFLQVERKIKRLNERGAFIVITCKPVSDTAIRDYIGKLRQIFKAAQDEYNDDEKGIFLIPHYPFRKFKMPKPQKAKKRNIKAAEIKLIRDYEDTGIRDALGRDAAMLSFYFAGMNTVDLYNVNDYSNGRISYKRTKTESRKGEDSFISVKVEPEAIPFIERNLDPTRRRVFDFYLRYNEPDNFNKAVNTGLKHIVKRLTEQGHEINPKLTSYYIRGAWSTIARNNCGVSKEDVHFALNHADPKMKVTDLYIDEDFSIIDRANRKVIDFINGK